MKKNLFFLVAIILGFTQSCKQIGDDDGDLLINLGANQGVLNGARFLYQEVNSIDTLAQYNYTGTRVVEVLEDSAKTKITYNGELINRINYDGVVEGDSTSYTRFYTYDATAKNIINISEMRSFYKKVHALVPTPVVNTKSLHDLTYSPENKLNLITSRTGKEIPGAVFALTSYVKHAFTYNTPKTNISEVKRTAGPLAGTVFGPAAEQNIFSYTEYDAKINPYTLLPFGYKVSKILEDPSAYYWLSANNPKRRSLLTSTSFIPVEGSTQFTYDAQGYAISGYGINYDYRPF